MFKNKLKEFIIELRWKFKLFLLINILYNIETKDFFYDKFQINVCSKVFE